MTMYVNDRVKVNRNAIMYRTFNKVKKLTQHVNLDIDELNCAHFTAGFC